MSSLTTHAVGTARRDAVAAVLAAHSGEWMLVTEIADHIDGDVWAARIDRREDQVRQQLSKLLLGGRAVRRRHPHTNALLWRGVS